jgi:BCD family chlorophyll transporter-like MFS transporter
MTGVPPLGWPGILRLALVQTALGSIIVLTTSTLNRVMVVELALPALLPGVLVALHHVVQLLRPRLGHGSDVGGRRTPWIVGGMAVLAMGGITAAVATAWMATQPVLGAVLAAVAFVAIGVGAGAAGTTLLVLLAKRVGDDKRAAAATIAWVMMIAGFILTATVAGRFLDPFSLGRLVEVTVVVSLLAFCLAVLAVRGIEGPVPTTVVEQDTRRTPAFRDALREVWNQSQARRFTVFVFVSMLAYSGQDLILEPFAGLAFGYSPGESTQLSGLQNAGVLLGMALFGVFGRGASAQCLRRWCAAGCVASAVALGGLAFGGFFGPDWPLRSNVFALGVANGAFAVAAISSMMALATQGSAGREGVRIGLWGAAQAIAFAAGGIVGTGAVDLVRLWIDAPGVAYAAVFVAEAVLFVWAASLALALDPERARRVGSRARLPLAGRLRPAEEIAE